MRERFEMTFTNTWPGDRRDGDVYFRRGYSMSANNHRTMI